MKYNLLSAASTLAMGAALGVAGVSAADAATIQTSGTFTFSNNLQGNKSVVVQGFNPALGNLTNVTAVYTVTADTLSNYVIASTTGQNASNSQSFDTVSLKTPNLPFGLAAGALTLSTSVNNITNAPVGKTVLSTSTFNPLPQSETFTTSTGLASFLGGPFTLTVHSSNTNNGSTTPSIAIGGSGTISGNIVVTYTYTAPPPPPPTGTPEPASLALLGAGLAGIGAIRRRKKD